MRSLLAACVAMLSLGAVDAAEYDGSKLLICANIEAADCEPGQPCAKARPEDLGAPAFIRIDIANKSIVGPRRTTPIVSMETSAQQILLQGTELGYAWSIALDTNNGKLTATLIDRDEAIVLFGACTVQ